MHSDDNWRFFFFFFATQMKAHDQLAVRVLVMFLDSFFSVGKAGKGAARVEVFLESILVSPYHFSWIPGRFYVRGAF